jgi:DNA polymerase III delta prime subunit
MDNSKHVLWVEKYRPHTLDEYIFHDKNQRKSFENYIATKTIPHLLLTGVAGTGKTTIAQILVESMEIDPTDVLLINASDENDVDTIRTKIRNFVQTFASGEFKIVHLEEADYLTKPAQAILRRFMEEYSESARFILTGNKPHLIEPAIRSRCQHFKFERHDKTDVTERVADILIREHVKFDLSALDHYVSVGYPDIRKIINLLQQNTSDGKLQHYSNVSGAEYKFKLLSMIESDDWFGARMLACEEVAAEEWEEVYRFLYENLDKSPKFSAQDKWEAGIVIIADHLYKHGIVADPEINAAAMFIRLTQM